MAPPKSVTAVKTAFLNEQVRILSQPLELPPDFQEHSSIPSKYIEHAMKELNRRYRHHTKSVYPSISIRQIAEQIDELYWSSGAPVATESQDGAVRKMDDFTNDQTISRLNQDFSSSEEYQEGLVRLQELAERRKQAQQKLQKYKALQDELDFLKGPANSVQPNLVTRDGPLALELTKSRALATKLAGRVSGLKRSNSTDADDGRPSKALLMSERARIQSALIDTND